MPFDQAALSSTREALHRLAEHVVAPCRWVATGRIGLRPHPTGLTTPPYGPDETAVAVELDELVVTERGKHRRMRVTTIRECAAFAGITPGAPASVYPPATPCELDAPLRLDVEMMRVLADWYAVGAAALAGFAQQVEDENPTEAQLWPEHLDLAITAGAVNFGFSPGDAQLDEPYAYVGPHGGPPAQDEFWNMPFGAARTMRDLPTPTEALAFLIDGRRRLTSGTASERSLS